MDQKPRRKVPRIFSGKDSAGASADFWQNGIPLGLLRYPSAHITVENAKKGFVTVQKSVFYGSNSGKCHSEPYFSWSDTVKKSKILFLTVLDSQKVRLQIRKSGI